MREKPTQEESKMQIHSLFLPKRERESESEVW